MLDDLKGYLNGIIDCADLILSDSSSPLNIDQQKDIETIRNSAIQEIDALKMVEQLLMEGRERQIRSISFEVHSPLISIKGYSEGILLELFGTFPEAQKEIVRQIIVYIDAFAKQIQVWFEDK